MTFDPSTLTQLRTDHDSLVRALDGRLKTLVVCLSNSWGGLEQVAATDAEDLARSGLDVHALVLTGSPIHDHLLKDGIVKVVGLGFRPRNALDTRLRKELLTLIDDLGTNLIHTHQPSLLGTIAPWLYQRPQVALFASRHIFSGHDKRSLWHRFIYRRVDHLIVMSQAMKKNAEMTHPLRAGQLVVVNLGLDFDLFDPNVIDAKVQRARWGADSETTVIGMVGRIDPAKGQSTLIRAAAGLLKSEASLPVEAGSRPQRLKFVIVGEETLGSTREYLQELKEMVRQFQLEDRVVFAGYQENIPEVMRAFDIFVMPSRKEAFGLVAIEAMAMECPIIVSNSGSADEIVGSRSDQPLGLTIRPEDAYDLQRQLKFLLSHPEEWREMGVRARAHVKENYDRRRRLIQTLALYESALARRSRFN